MKTPRFGLLPRVIAAILFGVLCGFLLAPWAVRVFVTFSSIFSAFLGFFIPLLIVGFVASGIAGIGNKGGKLLLLTLALAYGSTLFSEFFTWGACHETFPTLLRINESLSAVAPGERIEIAPYFTLGIEPVFDVMTALVLAFTLGLGSAAIPGRTMRDLLDDLKGIIEKVIGVFIIPMLPLYIFCIFTKMTAEGLFSGVFDVFLRLILLIFVLTCLLLAIQFGVAGLVARRNPIRLLAAMLPAWVTALGTQSSAVTIPVTLRQTLKNGVRPEIAEFVVPLCATVHLAGSTMKITACALAIIALGALDVSTQTFAGFIPLLGVTMVAAPGVPGGAIMAAVGILQSQLGFGETDIGLMIALYIIMDGFGTACNVTGDGAIAVIVNHLDRKRAAQ